MRTLALLTLLLLPVDSAAQHRWALGARAGIALPTQGIEGEDFGAGVGFEGSLRYRFVRNFWAYAGWDGLRFPPDLTLGGAETSLDEAGLVLGLRFERPFSGEGGPTVWLRGGATRARVEIEDLNGAVLADTGPGWGWEVGGGVGLILEDRWSFAPGIRYRSASHDAEIDATSFDIDLRYLSLEAAAAVMFE